MSDFLANLVARSIGSAATLKPRLAGLYEAPGVAAGAQFAPFGARETFNDFHSSEASILDGPRLHAAPPVTPRAGPVSSTWMAGETSQEAYPESAGQPERDTTAADASLSAESSFRLEHALNLANLASRLELGSKLQPAPLESAAWLGDSEVLKPLIVYPPPSDASRQPAASSFDSHPLLQGTRVEAAKSTGKPGKEPQKTADEDPAAFAHTVSQPSGDGHKVEFQDTQIRYDQVPIDPPGSAAEMVEQAARPDDGQPLPPRVAREPGPELVKMLAAARRRAEVTSSSRDGGREVPQPVIRHGAHRGDYPGAQAGEGDGGISQPVARSSHRLEAEHSGIEAIWRPPRAPVLRRPRMARQEPPTHEKLESQAVRPPSATIQVTIGRIEVRATPPPPAHSSRERGVPRVMGLDEYLRHRAGGSAK